MKFWDYHTHCYLCNHASGTIEDYIRSAIKCMPEIGISDHFPMELLPEHFHIYAMSLADFSKLYLDEIRKLQAKYKDKIIIKISTEVDFFPTTFREYKQIMKPFMDDFDYIIGSVHAVPWKGLDAIPIDEKQAISIIKEIGVDNVYLEYYDSVLRMVKSKFYHIVGHLDLPKKYGLFPQNFNEIWQKILQILDEVKSNGMAVEINTSGLKREMNQTYPSEGIIKELIQREIPITLGSDAHSPQNVGFEFEAIIAKVKKWGLTRLCQFSNQEKTLVPLA